MHGRKVAEPFRGPARTTNRSLPWESRAQDARTPDASRSPEPLGSREAFGVRPIYRRFPSSAGRPSGSWPQFTISESSRLSMNLPDHRIAACLGKAALKTHALRTLRAARSRLAVAKRLECVRFIGAFRPARDG